MDTKRLNNAFFRQLLFIVSLIAIGLIIYGQLNFFTSGVLGAITLYIALRPPLFYLIDKKQWKSWKASLVMVIAVTLGLLSLGFLIYKVIAAEVPAIDTSGLLEQFNGLAAQVNDHFNHKIIPDNFINESQAFIMNVATTLLNTTYNVLANLLMMVVLLYFMFAKAHPMEKAIMTYAPFKGNSMRKVKTEVKSMIMNNAVGIPLIMLGHALIAALGYWIFGIKGVAFWGFMTGVAGLLPVVGTTIIWVPLGIYLLASGNTWAGIGLIIFGAVVISNVDNILRAVLMKKMAGTHPLVTVIGVILGIPLFGFWGIIFGPLLISGFLLLIKIYYTEYGIKNEVEPS